MKQSPAWPIVIAVAFAATLSFVIYQASRTDGGMDAIPPAATGSIVPGTPALLTGAATATGSAPFSGSVSSGSTFSGTASSGSAVGLANPASTYCMQKGGTLTIKKNPSGAEYGVCYFEDNRQCEEWAFLRGDCPYGGRRITGYDDEAAIFCAISGGTVHMENKPVSCELPQSAGSCSAASFFANGSDCTKS